MKRNNLKEFTHTRIAVFIAVIILSLYPAIELTRCILQYNIMPGLYPPGYPAWLFPVELVIIWTGWGMTMFMLWWLPGLAYRMGRHG